MNRTSMVSRAALTTLRALGVNFLLLMLLLNACCPAVPVVSEPSIYDQFHIQNDDGEDRFFRYQTESGQFRSEVRSPSGAVTGSYGWVDADGKIRTVNYVADQQGYRIVNAQADDNLHQEPDQQLSPRLLRPVYTEGDGRSQMIKVVPLFDPITESTEAESEVSRTSESTSSGSRDVPEIQPEIGQPTIDYRLPTHFHRERIGRNGSRSGQYGYIDPLGVRRVVSFSVAPPDGSIHKTKQNRFVGRGAYFDAS